MTFISIESTREFIGKAKITEGVVFDRTGGSHPDIAYTTASGEKEWFPANGMISGYKLGERVRVLYNPDEPENRYINTFHDLLYPKSPDIDDFGAIYAWAFLCGPFGVCAIGLGIMALFGQVRYRR